MAYDYFGARIFHSVVRLLNDGEMVTHETLYKLGLERIIDRTTWLAEEIHRAASGLSSTASGTRATLAGTRNLSTLTLYDAETNPTGELGPGGLLDGRTLLLVEDTATPEEFYFVAPMSAAEVVDQIAKGAPTNKHVYLDENGRLVIFSKTVGASSSLTSAGSAAKLLGLPIGTATGSAGADDGASKIGFAPYDAWGFSAGTVRSAITKLMDTVKTLGETKANRAGETFTGPVTFNDTVTFNGNVNEAKFALLQDTSMTVDPSKAGLLLLPSLAASRTYTLAEPGAGPRRVRFVRAYVSSNSATIRRASDNSIMVVLMGGGNSWAEFWHVDGAWRPVGWGGAVSTVVW